MDRIEGDISVVKGGHDRGVEATPAIADDLGLERRNRRCRIR